MVRVNIVKPKYLSDQHLIAEYLEIIMLVEHTRKHPNSKNKPLKYCLGKGHICFFKDKLIYLKKRHAILKEEMKKRGFKTNKTLNLIGFNKKMLGDWKPSEKDNKIIRKRLLWKLRNKKDWYRYYGKKGDKFLIKLAKNAR